MAITADKVIAVAEAEIGYLEKASNSNLDDKTANAGSNNYTKYARDLDEIPGFYNGKKNGYAWCDIFVDYCFVKAFGVETARKLLNQPDKSLGAGCTFSARYFKQNGQLHKTPEIGDQIFFGTEDNVVHTGLVSDVDSTYVYTIEGNTSSKSGVVANGGCVCNKRYKLTNSRIYGYGRPDYDKEPEATTSKPVTPSQKQEECEVKLPILKKGYVGASAKALQLLLIGHGYSCGTAGADGKFGSNTLNAVKAYQKDKGLEVDGEVGSATWGSLLK